MNEFAEAFRIAILASKKDTIKLKEFDLGRDYSASTLFARHKNGKLKIIGEKNGK
jgi:hypothetical protein